MGRPARQAGDQADYLDSYAWLSAWHGTTVPRMAAGLRIPAVMDGDRPLGLLPMMAWSARRWESVGREDERMRYRPVLASERPGEEVLGLLAEGVGRAGARDLVLNRLPTRDPATGLLGAALRQAGFRVAWREESFDCLALVEGGWAEYGRRFARLSRDVRTKMNRLRSLWTVDLEEFGPATATSARRYDVYVDVYSRSWKRRNPRSAAWRAREHALLRRAEDLAGPVGSSCGWPDCRRRRSSGFASGRSRSASRRSTTRRWRR